MSSLVDIVGIADLVAALASPPGGLRVLVVPTDRHLGADTRRAIRHHLAGAPDGV